MKGKPEPMITYILQRKDGEWDCHYKKLKVLANIQKVAQLNHLIYVERG